MKKIALAIVTLAFVTLSSSCSFWAGVTGKKRSAGVGVSTGQLITPPPTDQVNSPVGMK